MNNLEQQAREWAKNMPTDEELKMSPADMISSYILSGRVMTLSALESMYEKLSQQPPAPVNGLSVEQLAQAIRVADGSNTLGAGALAEALLPMINSRFTALSQQAGEPVSDVEPVAWCSEDRKKVSLGPLPDKGITVPLYAHPPAAAPLHDVERLVEAGDALVDRAERVRKAFNEIIEQQDHNSMEWRQMRRAVSALSIRAELWTLGRPSLPKNEGEPQQQQ